MRALVSPFGRGKTALGKGTDSVGRQQEEGVGGDAESGDRLSGSRVSDLSLTDAEESFFIAEVDLDIPAPEVGLEELPGGEGGIGTYEISGLAVEDRADF